MLEIVDSHAHVVTVDRGRFPPLRIGDPAIDAIIERDFHAGRLLEEMDGAGVGKALLVQRGQIYGVDNSYVCAAAARNGGRLKAVCAVNARVEGCADKARELSALGAIGFRLMARRDESGFDWLDGHFAMGLWEAVADMALPMCVHFFPHAREEGLRRLLAVLDRLSVEVVIDHLTNPSITSAEDAGIDTLAAALADRREVTLKFTTIPLGRLEREDIDTGAVLAHYVALFGPDRLMWGSDVTQSPGEYGEMVAMACRAVRDFDTAAQAQLLGGTASRVYNLG